MSALQNWEGFWRQSGRGLAAGACVDASRSPSWHSVVIWYGLAVSDGDGDMKQRKESWVAQGVRSYGKASKGSSIPAPADAASAHGTGKG